MPDSFQAHASDHPPTARETILIVDDEESVRRTFREWLEGAALDCVLLSAKDAESALLQANQCAIDLAILDWNLGAGNDGLQLLEDLNQFNPNVVAIMITGFAHQATPLDAMRMGVRDYLDKNQDLNRDTFLMAVRRQLERIRPAKRERRLHHSLAAFREAVEKALPLVRSATALTDPVPLPQAVGGLMRFMIQVTQAESGVLLVRGYDAQRDPAEWCRVYDAQGGRLNVELVPFARSIAGGTASMQEPCVMNGLGGKGAAPGIELQAFERGRRSLLAVPMDIAPGLQVVLELFDKRASAGFSEEDKRQAAAAAELGTALLRQALAERDGQQMLFDALDAALTASDSVAASLHPTARPADGEPPPGAVMARIEESLRGVHGSQVDAGDTLRLAEAVRSLEQRHGSAAVRHCTELVESVCRLLDAVTGTAEARP
jgi:DNA-binding NarL/FixJ family response regulator